MSEQSRAPGTGDDGDGPDPGDGVAGDDGTGAGAAGQGDARVVGLDSAEAEDVLGAVASDTARSVLEAVHEEPATASGLADRTDRSLQTVQYHLASLADAGLVEPVDTAVSEKGREMDVYGPAGGPVVVYAGDDGDADDLRDVLGRLVSGVAFLGLLSLLVQELFGSESLRALAASGDGVTAEAARDAGTAGVEPGLLFFAGGLVVLAAYLAAWYLRRAEPFDGALPGA